MQLQKDIHVIRSEGPDLVLSFQNYFNRIFLVFNKTRLERFTSLVNQNLTLFQQEASL